MKLFGYDIKLDVRNEQKIPRGRKSKSNIPTTPWKYETREDLRTFRLAVDNAKSVNRDRYDLHQIYRRVMRDPTVLAQWNTRKMKTYDKEFKMVTSDGSENESVTEMFEAPWFKEFVSDCLDSIMWGFTLFEFGPYNNEKDVFEQYFDDQGHYHDAVEVIDRDFVKPEWGIIVSTTGDMEGVDIFNEKTGKNLLFVGKNNDYGLLYACSQYVLMKENVLQNWSEYAEIMGMDIRWVQSEAQGEDRQSLLSDLAQMGSAGYAVIGTDEELHFSGIARRDAFLVYQQFALYADQQIAKLIFGQDVVTNNTGRVVGEVGENISNLYGDADAKFIQWIVNNKLMPFMEKRGADFHGCKFKYDLTEHVGLSDRIEIDATISEMGFVHPKEYINRTYGTEVDRAKMPSQPDPTKNY